MLDEHGGGQHDIGGARGVGHELLVHADEQIDDAAAERWAAPPERRRETAK